MERRVEVMIAGHGWLQIPISDVLEGDVFRMFEATGEPVTDDKGETNFIAKCDAFQENVLGELVWVLESED